MPEELTVISPSIGTEGQANASLMTLNDESEQGDVQLDFNKDTSRQRELPPEIYTTIARYLLDDEASRSCANLGAVSRSAYSGCLPVLYRVVSFEERSHGPSNDWTSEIGEGTRIKAWLSGCLTKDGFPGRRYIKFFKLPTGTIDSSGIANLFARVPHLAAVIRYDSGVTLLPCTTIDLGPRFRYGSNDWQNIALRKIGIDSSRGGDYRQDQERPLDNLDQRFRGCRLNIDFGQPPTQKTWDIDSVFNDVTAILHCMDLKHDIADSEEDGEPSLVTISSASLADARAFMAILTNVIPWNTYYASMNLHIQCVGPGSTEEVERILQSAFEAITPLLSEIDQRNLGIWEIEFPSLHNLSGTIFVEPDGEGDDRLWLEMQDDDSLRIVDSVLWPHDEGDDEEDTEEDDSDEEDTNDSNSDSDDTDESSSSPDSDSGISAATLQMLSQTTLQMTMLATAMITDRLDTSLLLRMAQLQQVQLTQLLANLDSESESEDAESENGRTPAEGTEEGEDEGA